MRTIAAVGLVIMAASIQVALAEPQIIGFDRGEGLQFQGATVSNYYTLEFAAHVNGPWTNWGAVSDQPITGSVMSLPSPFFYRIRQVPNSQFPPYATGTPIYAESDPLWTTEKSGYATGTPVYAESDPLWSADKPHYATGTPIYAESDPLWIAQKANYATGTPVYAENDPVWIAEKSKYATGTPVYGESDPIFTASPAAGISVTDTQHWQTAYGWGDHHSAGYLSNGQAFNVDPDTGNVGVGTWADTNTVRVVGGIQSINMSGLVSIFDNADQVSGSGTTFLTDLSPSNRVLIGGILTGYVKQVNSDTIFTLTQTNHSGNLFAVAIRRLDNQPLMRLSTEDNSSHVIFDRSGNIVNTGFVQPAQGIKYPDGSIGLAASGLGDVEIKLPNTTYIATNSGFVLFTELQYWYDGVEHKPAYVIYADRSSSPSNILAIFAMDAQNLQGNCSIMAPVPKGYYWKATSSDGVRCKVKWIPMF